MPSANTLDCKITQGAKKPPFYGNSISLPFVYKTDHFTKTGSGRTYTTSQGKKKEMMCKKEAFHRRECKKEMEKLEGEG